MLPSPRLQIFRIDFPERRLIKLQSNNNRKQLLLLNKWLQRLRPYRSHLINPIYAYLRLGDPHHGRAKVISAKRADSIVSCLLYFLQKIISRVNGFAIKLQSWGIRPIDNRRKPITIGFKFKTKENSRWFLMTLCSRSFQNKKKTH